MAKLGNISYTSVTWTAGDIATEAKMDNMVANDQSYDAHSGQGLLLENNKSLAANNTNGTADDLIHVDGSNFVRFGGTTHTETTAGGVIIDEDDFSTNSNKKIPTQQSVKEYVDSKKRIVEINLLDDTTDTSVTDGVGDITFTIPQELNGWNLVDAHASVETAGTTGTTDIQIHNVTDAVDMLSTKITIDSGELTSYTAATAPVVDGTNDDVATGDKLRVDVDSVSSTAAKGLTVILTFQLP